MWLVLLIFATSSHAMNYGDFRRSDNVEDRREEGTFSPNEPAGEPMLVLLKVAPLAQAGKMPFLCPALKPVASDAAKLGQALAKAKTMGQLRAEYAAMANSIPAQNFTAGADACAGSKQSISSLLSKASGGAAAALSNVTAQHSQPISLAESISGRLHRGPVSSVAQRVSELISSCPKYTAAYLAAVDQYQGQYVLLVDSYSRLITNLERQRLQVQAISCGGKGR